MALLRQCLYAVRALRGDEVPPALIQRSDVRRMDAVDKTLLASGRRAQGRRDEAPEDAATNSPRRSLQVAMPHGRAR
jgi:hypothetical protein